jgi:hypothetical protein
MEYIFHIKLMNQAASSTLEVLNTANASSLKQTLLFSLCKGNRKCRTNHQAVFAGSPEIQKKMVTTDDREDISNGDMGGSNVMLVVGLAIGGVALLMICVSLVVARQKRVAKSHDMSGEDEETRVSTADEFVEFDNVEESRLSNTAYESETI